MFDSIKIKNLGENVESLNGNLKKIRQASKKTFHIVDIENIGIPFVNQLKKEHVIIFVVNKKRCKKENTFTEFISKNPEIKHIFFVATVLEKNSADMHCSFLLGQIISRIKPAHVYLYSNDKAFKTIVLNARKTGNKNIKLINAEKLQCERRNFLKKAVETGGKIDILHLIPTKQRECIIKYLRCMDFERLDGIPIKLFKETCSGVLSEKGVIDGRKECLCAFCNILYSLGIVQRTGSLLFLDKVCCDTVCRYLNMHPQL